MKVFLCGTSFRPEYGGPARSVSGLAHAIREAGCEVGVWAPDRSAVNSPFLSADSGLRLFGGDLRGAIEEFGEPDLIHDNGIWLRHNHQLAGPEVTGGVPRLVSVRGMLEPWALRHRRWKKKVAWILYQRRDLRSATCHHVTSEAERRTVSGFGWKVPGVCIPNGVAPAPEAVDAGRRRGGDGPRVALFVGRIHPVKGLPMLVEAWKEVRPNGWRLQIVGHDEDGYRAVVERAVQGAGLSGQVEFAGPLEGPEKEAAYRSAELFILPSHTENFGMAVGEALARRLPVITTTGAPWPMLEKEGCGWWVEPTIQGIARALREATAQPKERLAEMGERGARLVAKEFAWEAVGRRMVAVYEWLVHGGTPPEDVSGGDEHSSGLVIG